MLILSFLSTGSSSGLANANFANFDDFPKSCSADFASFSSTQSNSVGEVHKVEAVSFSANRYAALADLDNVFGTKPEQGTSRNETTIFFTSTHFSVHFSVKCYVKLQSTRNLFKIVIVNTIKTGVHVHKKWLKRTTFCLSPQVGVQPLRQQVWVLHLHRQLCWAVIATLL